MYNGPQRKNQRFKNFDYSQKGFYFVTICTKSRENYFGEIIDGKMVLNNYGKIAEKEILKTEKIRKEIKIDKFIIMPNHLHLIVIVENDCSAKNDCAVGNTGPCSLQGNESLQGNDCAVRNTGLCSLHKTKNKLSNTIQRIKSSITLKIRKENEDFRFAWQKSFFDVIIRNDDQLEKTRLYIIDNPMKWELDKNNPTNIKNKNVSIKLL